MSRSGRPGGRARTPTLREVIHSLSRPDAYPHEVDEVEVVHTHISVVFLAGTFVYKVKKPVDLGFLDFTTLERRLRFCREEVRLNRRLARSVYVGVVPLVREGDGVRVAEERLDPVEESGETGPGAGTAEPRPVEYAVTMRRLPEEATLLARLERGELGAPAVRGLGHRLARFHARAASGPRIARYGRFDVVARNARENLEQARAQLGVTLSERLLDRLSRALERELARLRPTIERRAAAGVPRDTHGDLHLQHVYLFPERDPPRDIVVIDCIEFNERFRHADPVADMAFLHMDLAYRGRRDLAGAFAEAYFEASGDEEGRGLLGFYAAYRAAVRGKVEGMKVAEAEVPAEDRREAARRARAHWLLALRELEPPEARPGLVLVGGLPGTGKSTLARALGERHAFEALSSDPTRKRLAGIDPGTSAAAEFGAGIYTEEWNERTYAALREQARARLLDGGRVIVDASFRREERRRRFLGLAESLCVPGLYLECDAPAEVVRARLAARADAGEGASDADVGIYERAAERWEAQTPDTEARSARVDTGGDPERSLEAATAALRDAGLAGSSGGARSDRGASAAPSGDGSRSVGVRPTRSP